MAKTSDKTDLSPEDGARIVDEAARWKDTPYAPDTAYDRYKGPGAKKGVEADCSGSVWRIYGLTGYGYPDIYSHLFDHQATLPDFPFRKLGDDEIRQRGDVVLFFGHMSIYDSDGTVWSAHKPGTPFSHGPVSDFGHPIGYCRFQIPARDGSR